MEVHLSEQLCSLIHNFKVGIIHYNEIEVGESPQILQGKMQTLQQSLFFDLEEKNVTDLESIKEWRQIFKTTGKDPNRYRHSAEALCRRVKKQNYLTPVNSAIDVNNLFSLKYQIPIGIYDVQKLNGNVSIRLGKDDEEYVGLNGRTNSVSNLIVSTDDAGPFGSLFVDSERTAVTPATKNALHIVFLQPSMDHENASKMVESLMNMFLQIHGGDASFELLGCYN